MNQPNPDEWLRLHTALYDGVDDLLLGVCSKQDFTGIRVPIDDPDAAWEYAASQAFKDVYFRIAAMRDREYDPGERGGKADSALITCLWADVDVARGVHAKDNLPTGRAAGRIIRSVLAPSAIVNSGGGYHCYWLLDEPLDPNSTEGRDLLNRFASLWKGQFALRGFGFDAGVGRNCAGVLRMPGTLNVKGELAQSVVVKECDPFVTYSVEDLLKVAPPAVRVGNAVSQATRRLASQRIGGGPGGRGFISRVNRTLDIEAMLDVWGLVSSHSGERWIFPKGDGSLSGSDTHAQVFDCRDGVPRVTAFGDRLQVEWGQDDISHSLSCFDLLVIATRGDVEFAKRLFAASEKEPKHLYSALREVLNARKAA